MFVVLCSLVVLVRWLAMLGVVVSRGLLLVVVCCYALFVVRCRSFMG